jgi:hypothetical protein
MQQLTLFGLSCALVSIGTALAFVASLVGERGRRPSALAAGVFTVLGVVALFAGAMTV